MIDSNKSSLGGCIWSIIKKWFTENGENNIIIERVMNDLETLALTKKNTVLLHISNFTDNMIYLELAGAILLMNYQI